jgi:hypothetical protein
MRRALDQRANVKVSLSAKVVDSAGLTERCVLITALLENIGSSAEVINWNSVLVRSAPVIGFNHGTPKLGLPRNTSLVAVTQLSTINLDPASEESLPFLLPLEAPGLHFVEFVATAENQRERALADAGLSGAPRYVADFRLTCTTFVCVS